MHFRMRQKNNGNRTLVLTARNASHNLRSDYVVMPDQLDFDTVYAAVVKCVDTHGKYAQTRRTRVSERGGGQ